MSKLKMRVVNVDGDLMCMDVCESVRDRGWKQEKSGGALLLYRKKVSVESCCHGNSFNI